MSSAFTIGLYHPVHGGMGLFRVHVREVLTPLEVSTFLNTISVYLQYESFHQLYRRVRVLLGQKVGVDMDANLETMEPEEREEWIVEMLDGELVIHTLNVEGQWVEMEYPMTDPTGEQLANLLSIDMGRVHRAW